jgi:hypothetical protein
MIAFPIGSRFEKLRGSLIISILFIAGYIFCFWPIVASNALPSGAFGQQAGRNIIAPYVSSIIHFIISKPSLKKLVACGGHRIRRNALRLLTPYDLRS